MTYLVTGCAGFIGYHVVKQLLNNYESITIVGLDNLNNYYDVKLKEDRLADIRNNDNFIFYKCDISDRETLNTIFNKHKFDKVINLAAQAGVRYSITNPDAYMNSNVIGFYNILECCKTYDVKYLVYASSSSVYGNDYNPKEENMKNDPVSFYAATKITNEVMAASYSNMYNIYTTGLRFFTVYGPWGRPDMAIWKFVEKAYNGEYIELYDRGQLKRDFTYIDDVVDGIIKCCDNYTDELLNHRIYNIGNNNPITVANLVYEIEKIIGFEIPKTICTPRPVGDVLSTYANIDNIKKKYHWQPKTSITDGLTNFINWYKTYKNIS